MPGMIHLNYFQTLYHLLELETDLPVEDYALFGFTKDE
jgi:hypothetical protein